MNKPEYPELKPGEDGLVQHKDHKVKIVRTSENDERIFLKVSYKEKDAKPDDKPIDVPMPLPLVGEQFHINGVVFKITYSRNNPFRISAEPTMRVMTEFVQEQKDRMLKTQKSMEEIVKKNPDVLSYKVIDKKDEKDEKDKKDEKTK